ncbi:hypothetical protein D3C78_1862250 [compost metagenome]
MSHRILAADLRRWAEKNRRHLQGIRKNRYIQHVSTKILQQIKGRLMIYEEKKYILEGRNNVSRLSDQSLQSMWYLSDEVGHI